MGPVCGGSVVGRIVLQSRTARVSWVHTGTIADQVAALVIYLPQFVLEQVWGRETKFNKIRIENVVKNLFSTICHY